MKKASPGAPPKGQGAAQAPPTRSQIFTALAQGLEIPQVQARFGLTRAQLQLLFKEVADLYRGQETGPPESPNREAGYWQLHCDGASRGNPGPAGAGIVLTNPQGTLEVEESRYLGETTNNVAEYRALLLGLAVAQTHGVRKLRIFADSQLLVEQLNGRYRVKSAHLFPLWQQAKKELQKFEAHAISHVDRELNSQADRLAREAVDQRAESS